MAFDFDNIPITRRTALGLFATGATALLMDPLGAAAQQKILPAKPFPFKLGLQSYSLNKMSFEDALAKTKSLGIKWWEGFPGHVPMTDDAGKIASYQKALQANGVKMISYGVVDFSTDEADARRKFQFAKAMGIGTLTAAPSPESLPLLDKLTTEYGVNIGIHNHGPDDARWGDWQTILSAVKPFNTRVGACDDTGHYLMADKNPITAAVQFGPRLHSIHLKNVGISTGPNKQKVFEPIGTTGGLFDVVQLLRFMKEKNYQGIMAIEEEEQPDDPMPGITKSLEAMRRYINTVNTVALMPDKS
jgi:sugar phosphate isomerase/epimerase